MVLGVGGPRPLQLELEAGPWPALSASPLAPVLLTSELSGLF
jgi:hypothetical protein